MVLPVKRSQAAYAPDARSNAPARQLAETNLLKIGAPMQVAHNFYFMAIFNESATEVNSQSPAKRSECLPNR